MAIKITSTKNYASEGVKVLVSGPAGIGKTVLCASAPSPIIISAEAGLLSLAGEDLPVIEVTSVSDVMDAYEFLTSSVEANQYKTLCLDSISEIGEVLLAEYKKLNKDPRAAYGQLNDDMASLIRSFRDIKGKHVYFSAKQSRLAEDDSGRIYFKASMPGKTLLNGLPYFFDEVFVMNMGKLEDGTLYRYLQTSKDLRHEDCKDRSGKLDAVEKPDLSHIFDKIAGGKKEERQPKREPEDEAENRQNELLKELADGMTKETYESFLEDLSTEMSNSDRLDIIEDAHKKLTEHLKALENECSNETENNKEN